MSSSPGTPSTRSGREGAPGSLPERWIRLQPCDSHARPIWLTDDDHEWLEVFIAEVRRLEGRTVDEFRTALDKTIVRACMACGAPPRAVRGLAALVPSAWSPGVISAARPSEIRQILFETAASGVSRREAILRTAGVLRIAPEAVLPGAFADRSGVRRLTAPQWPVTAESIARHYNLALVRALLLKTSELVVRVGDPSAALVQAAKAQRLICDWRCDDEGTRMIVSGPTALFRHTTRYGHALLRFLPAVMESGAWRIDAQCTLGEVSLCVQLSNDDPIGALASARPKSSLTPERAVLRAFRCNPAGWVVTRESEAVRAGNDIFFPDLRIVRGSDVVRLEWTGFHTPGFLEDRLARMRRAELGAWLLCVDESLGTSDVFDDPMILRYHKAVGVPALIERLEQAVAQNAAHAAAYVGSVPFTSRSTSPSAAGNSTRQAGSPGWQSPSSPLSMK